MRVRYVVKGRDWPGTMQALACVWDADLPPVPKLVLIRYADCPGTVAEVATFARIAENEALAITEQLAERGLIGEAYEPPPPKPSWAALRELIFERDRYRCRHCGTSNDLSLDHVYPKSKGGTDDPENLQTLCRPCNSRKGARVE